MLGSEAVRTLEHDWRMLTRSVDKAFRDGQLSKAEDICWEGLSKAKLIGEFEPRLAISLSNLAVIQRLRGQRDRAEDLSNIALRIFQAVDRRSPLMAKGLLNAAGEARRLYSKAITLLEANHCNELLCQALLLYARLCSDQGRDAQAETLLKRVQSLEPDSTSCRMLYQLTSAQVAIRMDRLGRAEQMLDEGVRIFEEGLELEAIWLSSMLALRGDLEAAMYSAARQVSGTNSSDLSKKKTAVVHSFQQALDIREGVFGPFHASCGDIHRRLAAFYLETGSYEVAEQLLRKALTIALSARGPYHFETLKCLENSQEMLRLAGRHSEASEMETRVGQVEKKVREKARETYVVWGEPDDNG
jgi:tetratricopeptide (TPR) repeat protein